MSLVTLIQKIESADRDAVVQIEDFLLPKEAEFTGKVDAAGRRIYSVVKNIEVTVGADVTAVAKKVVTEVKKVEPTSNTESKLAAEAKKIETEVKTELKAAVNAVVNEAEKVATELGLHKANTTNVAANVVTTNTATVNVANTSK